jgi:hypothetical protein
MGRWRRARVCQICRLCNRPFCAPVRGRRRLELPWSRSPDIQPLGRLRFVPCSPGQRDAVRARRQALTPRSAPPLQCLTRSRIGGFSCRQAVRPCPGHGEIGVGRRGAFSTRIRRHRLAICPGGRRSIRKSSRSSASDPARAMLVTNGIGFFGATPPGPSSLSARWAPEAARRWGHRTSSQPSRARFLMYGCSPSKPWAWSVAVGGCGSNFRPLWCSCPA